VDESPPQADTAFRIPQTFSRFSPVLSAGTESTGTSTKSTRSTRDVINSEDGVRLTKYFYEARQVRAESIQPQGKDEDVREPHRSIFLISPGPQISPRPPTAGDHHMEKSSPSSQGEKEPGHDSAQARGIRASLVREARTRTDSGFSDGPLPVRRFRNIELGPGANLGETLEGKLPSNCDWHLFSTSRPMGLSMRRKVRQTPSGRLLAALPPRAQKIFASPMPSKMDLSYVSIRPWENRSRRHKSWKGLHVMKQILRLKPDRRPHVKHISLSVILTDYLAERFVCKDRALSKLHEAETVDYLRSRGYGVDDVLAWSRILSSSNTDHAVTRFIAAADYRSSSDGTRLPTFLLMFIIRARSLKASNLRLLLSYIWKHYVRQFAEPDSYATTQLIHQQTAMIMIVRLIRHARIVWPYALEEIAALATKFFGRQSTGIVNLGRNRIQGFSHLYSRLLALFAVPTSLRPVLSVVIQQRSQFCLVREMTAFKPHLPVTREGFRGLAKVQLAHKKTEPEREWAMSKALSWPPWKEELLGIEADSEDPGRYSRAVDVLSRMTEAGYSHLQWEQTAHILAGWDTDGSPTIQTRTLLKQSPILPSSDVKLEAERSKSKEDGIWAARVLATRTVKEAWACFTSYDKSSGGCHTVEPYNAMFARLLHAREQDDRDEETTSVVPGDGRETWPEPTSPHDFLYVPSDPPSVNEFFDVMKKKGLLLGEHLLRDLLDNAETLAEGVRYINASILHQSERDALLGTTEKNAEQTRASIKNISHHVVAAFVRLLCRAHVTRERKFVLPKSPGSKKTISKETRTRDPFFYAQRFVLALQPSYRPIWYALYEGLNRRTSMTQIQVLYRSWDPLINQLRHMDELGVELDFDGFKDIGEILEEVLLTNRSTITPPDQAISYDLRGKCVSLCKKIFNAMAYGGSVRSKNGFAQSSVWLPFHRSSPAQDRTPLIDIPTPAILHRTIRILGMGEDSGSIVILLRWMHCFAPELASIADDLANSKKLTRYAITAVPYFIEKTWRDDDFNLRVGSRDQWQPVQKELLGEARGIIEQHRDDWGGWPTVDELYRYHSVNRQKARRLRENLGFEDSRSD
jgi:hypothetical protein